VHGGEDQGSGDHRGGAHGLQAVARVAEGEEGTEGKIGDPE